MESLKSIRQNINHVKKEEVVEESRESDSLSLEEVEESKIEELRTILSHLSNDKESVIPALQAVQDEYGYLPGYTMEYIAEKCDTSLAHVYGTATFYGQFYLSESGDYTIKVCTGTACHVKGADEISEHVTDQLGVELEEVTDDGRFTVTHVRCIGCCSLAPAVMVGNEVYGDMNEEKVGDMIEEYR
jgi:NADH:ubiquinone oxidoreductase subunit E